MLTVESAAFFSSIVTTFFANILAVTVVGYVRALVSAWFGDDTSEQVGLATLNPLAHVDAIFLISFMIFGIGLGQYPMINPDLMDGAYKKIKFIIASFINTFLYLLIATIALASLLIFFGPSILDLFRTIAIADASVMKLYPNLSSISFTLALVGLAAVHINSRLAIFSLVINLIRLVGFPLLNSFFEDSKHKDLWVLVGSIVFIYLLFDLLHLVTGWIILGAGYTLAYVFGFGV